MRQSADFRFKLRTPKLLHLLESCTYYYIKVIMVAFLYIAHILFIFSMDGICNSQFERFDLS